MPRWVTARMRHAVLFTAMVAVGLLFAGSAYAAGPAASTIVGCKDDHLTVVGAVKLSGPAARKARGATLQLQFQALPMFGFPKSVPWRDLGKKTKGSGQQAFTALGSDSWVGVMRWRFKKGSRTVLSGVERSRRGKAGSARGVAFCTLSEGLKPLDTTPPSVFISPVDQIWHHSPVQVQVYATDDLSGVRAMAYSVDGGPATPISSAGFFPIEAEGAHQVVVAATDVAGNVGSAQAVVQVDANPPSKPVLTSPFSVTTSTAPTFTWTPSTDSASGIRGYFLAIKKASDGSLVSFTPLDANTTSAQSPQTLADGETYVASVVAVDNTDQSFQTESDPLTFRVDTHLDITGFNPPDGSILAFGAQDGDLTVSLDRPADRGSVGRSTVSLTRDPSDANDADYTVSCGSSCDTIVIHPSKSLPEGRYTLTVDGVKSQEGQAFTPATIHFAVRFYNNNFDGTSCNGSPSAPFAGSGWTCAPHGSLPGNSFGTDAPTRNCGSSISNPQPKTLTATSAPISFTTTADNEQVVVYYDYVFSTSDGGDTAVTTISVDGGQIAQDPLSRTTSPANDKFTFTVATAGAHQLTFKADLTLQPRVDSNCGLGQQQPAGLGLAFDNVVGSRHT